MSLIIEKHFVVLEYFQRPWKFLNSCEIGQCWTTDYIIQESRFKQCSWTG